MKCIEEPEVLPVQELLSEAEQFVSDLEAKGKPAEDPERDVQRLLLPMKDVDKGPATGFFRREQVDQVLGAGRWGPVPEHVVLQWHNGKCRAIGDTLRASHNRYLAAWERVHTS